MHFFHYIGSFRIATVWFHMHLILLIFIHCISSLQTWRFFSFDFLSRKFSSCVIGFICTDEQISGGTVTIQVFYLGVPVHTEKDDLCSKTSCPILPGEFALNNSEGLPDFTPTVCLSHWPPRMILKFIYLVIYICICAYICIYLSICVYICIYLSICVYIYIDIFHIHMVENQIPH